MLRVLGCVIFILATSPLCVQAQTTDPAKDARIGMSTDETSAIEETRFPISQLDTFVQRLGHTGYRELDRALDEYSRDKSTNNQQAVLRVLGSPSYRALKASPDGNFFSVPTRAAQVFQNAAQSVVTSPNSMPPAY